MSVFRVKYCRKGKPTGTRGYIVFADSSTFEKVLFDFTLQHLCETNYYMDYLWFMLNEHLFIKRTNANGIRCEYTVLLFDMKNRSKLITEYEVEIECLENDGSVDLLKQDEDLKVPKIDEKPVKEKLPTEWYKNESRAIRWFLFWLSEAGSLKQLKKADYMSKATYHRNLKICQEKGYIKGEKLAKRLFVSKQEKVKRNIG